MARAQINYLVLKPDGAATPSASAQVNIRGGGAATVFTGATGGTTAANPIISDSEGRLAGWLDEGSYDVTITAAGVPTVLRGVEILAGAGTFAEADNSITTAQIADASVTTAKLANNAVSTAIIVDANVTADKLADADKVGLTSSTVVRRGKSNVTFSSQRASTNYGPLNFNPDHIDVVLGTDGLIVVTYQAHWSNPFATSSAAIFLNGIQLTMASPSVAAPPVQETTLTATGNESPISSYQGGILSNQASVVYAGDVTTGQVIATNQASNAGGPCYIFGAAGAYSIDIYFKTADGSPVTVTDRKFRAWTIGF